MKKRNMKGEKAKLLEEATGYVLGTMFVYLADMLKLPARMRETSRLFADSRRNKPESEPFGSSSSTENSLIYWIAK